ncbi:MAG TPA: GyrI-like domain-containing protein [Bacteroidia bacterium]|nr:GyrI-like domain-containing protein [Bacteroidia bacterium]
MFSRIQLFPEKKLVGIHRKMSFSKNETFQLWNTFMPRRNEIINNLSDDLFSVQIYKDNFFQSFDPSVEFLKWAAKEVADFDSVPEGMETLLIETGLYAVFIHRGQASKGPKTFGYIFGNWFPESDYKPDNRPHFEILGEKYKHEDPESEEEIWIPICPKA